MKINYDNKFFRSSSNSETGEVSAATIFHYRQKNEVVWATYQGGAILFGTLVAKITGSNQLEMRYSHVNESGELMTGECVSTPEILPDGRIRLHEKWRWTCGEKAAGESVVEEIEVSRKMEN
jgi:hypothetical protein